jgi:hypothetical protein
VLFGCRARPRRGVHSLGRLFCPIYTGFLSWWRVGLFLIACLLQAVATHEAMINLQAFIFNAFGCIDNLACWVKEKGLQHDGSPIPDTWIGLRENNTFVRQSFSIEFQEYLNGRNAWFKNLENFRHALAHRIPPYISPYTIPNDKVAAYQQQEKDRMAALGRRDKAEYERLSSEQRAVAEFVPCMKHSFEEATTIYFHPQVLTDFLTIEDLAQKMLKELDS